MASGDWGGGGAKRAGSVKRSNVVKNTINEPEAKPAQGDAPVLKYYSSPQYPRGPFNPKFRNLRANGN